MKYLHTTPKHNVYELDCPGCGATGEIGVPHCAKNVAVQHECGTLFMQRPATGMFGNPNLMVVEAK